MIWPFDSFFIQCTIFCVLLYFTHTESLIGEKISPLPVCQFSYVGALVKVDTKDSTIDVIGTASLISRKHVLTAVYHLQHTPSQFIKVFLGSHNLSSCDIHEISSWKSYDTWATQNHIPQSSTDRFGENDIAIITLSTPVRGPCVTHFPDLFYKEERVITALTIVGWNNSPDASGINVLKYGAVKLIPTFQCESRLSKIEGRPIIIDESKYFCTDAEPYVLGDHNHGDRGAPIIVKSFFAGFLVKGYLDKSGPMNEKVNIHININLYENFIRDAIKEDRKFK